MPCKGAPTCGDAAFPVNGQGSHPEMAGSDPAGLTALPYDRMTGPSAPLSRNLGEGGPAGASVRPFKQAAGDHLGLDLGGAFEDVEDAGVAEDAAHGVLEREAVAAVDLDGIVGVGPGDA